MTLIIDSTGTVPDPEGNRTDSEALDAIAALLDGTEWNVDTLMAISEHVLTTGRTLRDTSDD